MNRLLKFFYKYGDRLKEASVRCNIPLGTLGCVVNGSRRMTPAIREKLAKGYGVRPRSIPDPYPQPAAKPKRGARDAA